jgi:hypothetical protein
MKRVAIVQSSYIPWKGYFSLIQLADAFILYDDVQYTRRDWRNRNQIKTPAGTSWLTIPVTVRGRREQRVRDVQTRDGDWARKHWLTLQQFYARADYFDTLRDVFGGLYERCREERQLSRINFLFIKTLRDLLGIETPLSWSMDYLLEEGRSQRLVGLCRQVGATEYLTGPMARSYLDETLFTKAGIRVRWMDYSGYPEYPQLFTPPFIHEVSAIDLLMNLGPRAAGDYLADFKRDIEARFARDTSAEQQPYGIARS